MQNKMTPPKIKKKLFVLEIRKIGTFNALYLDSHVFFSKKKYKVDIQSIIKRIIR